MGSCTNCGSELPSGARICPTCSHPVGIPANDPTRSAAQVPNAVQDAPASATPRDFVAAPLSGQRTDAMAIASLVCGILGLVAFPVVLSIVAIVLGKQSRDRIEASNGAIDGLGLAKAGFILGIVGVALGVLVILLVVLIFGAFLWGDMKFG